jgi:hypothetical protein
MVIISENFTISLEELSEPAPTKAILFSQNEVVLSDRSVSGHPTSAASGLTSSKSHCKNGLCPHLYCQLVAKRQIFINSIYYFWAVFSGRNENSNKNCVTRVNVKN